ncbi:hypothetical protein SAMN03080617_00511 [Algoriphagus alkaliphilus]|uniref:Uncharacterized protein n=1 Tax=Algoriphagus alkaliphilus TaxID=279824 RepID=A0A1G5VI03_9BACT|nr:hypothetical protein [Algoriphagus alkaliphilus]SDA44705.1 hypothetical protein SAMN03080617_00511 [Algoriphagus alkaliphilus]
MKEELKGFLIRLWPLFLLFVGLPLFSFAIWHLLPGKKLDILVINKTVINQSYQEHAGLFWSLNHLKYKKSDGEFYQIDKDYLGFFPTGKQDFGMSKDLKGKSQDEIRALVRQQDLLYIADTYGVYEGDFSNRQNVQITKKIYGGLDYADLQMLRIAKEEGKVVVAEYNSIASPTPKAIRTEFENLMGIKWTGWIGRYFDELDTLVNGDIPGWMIRQYERQHEIWNLSGPGLIFIKESGEIEAFVHTRDYENKIPLIRTQKINKHGFKLPEVVPYPDWFDVVMIERDYQVISYYDIAPTSQGLQRMRSMGLPRFFPAAIVRNFEKGSQFYFSGDFSDIRGDFGSHRFYGMPTLWRGLYVASDYTDRQSFFWNYYLPLVTQVLDKSKKESN